MDKKERILQVINNKEAKATISSIIVCSLRLRMCNEVKTMKQNPNKLEEELSICGDLLLSIMGILLIKKTAKSSYTFGSNMY